MCFHQVFDYNLKLMELKKIDNFKNVYSNDLIKKNKMSKKIKAVVACGNGTAGIFAPEILKGIGCDVIELDCKLDWSFPKYNPNPEDIEMLQDLVLAATNDALSKADDVTADRLGKHTKGLNIPGMM